MALELSNLDRKVIMAYELSLEDSRTTSCPSKRAREDTPSGTGVAISPTKRRKRGVAGDKLIEDVMPQQGKSNARGQPFAEEDLDVGGNECEPLRVSDGRNNAGDGTASSSGLPLAADDTIIEKECDPLDSSENLELTGVVEPVFPQRRCTPHKFGRHLAGPTVSEREPKSVAGSFRFLVRVLADLRGRLEGRDEANVEKALLTICYLELMCAQQLAETSDTGASPDSDPGDIDVDDGPPLAANATAAGEKGREFSDGQCSDNPDLGDEFDYALDLGAPASVSQRQQNDRELREEIHKVEIDYWANRQSRDVYNEERFKLYTEEERKEARVVWPRRVVQSPAGYREGILERSNDRRFHGGPSWDDDLYQFGCPFEEQDYGRDEEAAKTRLRDKIEGGFEDPDARRAEYVRWEKIRKIETMFYNKKMSRTEYNQRRLALYTKAEREGKGVVWPRKDSEMCYSPAGFREAVFDQCDRTEEGPDWQTRMDFHYPFAHSSTNSTSEENLCEICVPLIESHRDFLGVQEVRRQEVEAIQKEEEAKRLLDLEEKRRRRQETKVARENGIPCVQCNRKFLTERDMSQHALDKHQQ